MSIYVAAMVLPTMDGLLEYSVNCLLALSMDYLGKVHAILSS